MYASLRRFWLPLFCNLFSLIPASARAYLVRSTPNGSAKTSSADHMANGYLIFMPYSVALLAYYVSPSHLSEAVLDAYPLCFSCSLYRAHNVYDHPPLLWRVKWREKQDSWCVGFET